MSTICRLPSSVLASLRRIRSIAAGSTQWDRQNFCVRPVIRHAFTKRSLNMTANCVFASAHSRGGRFHSAAALFKTKYSSFVAASSEGKCPLVLTAGAQLGVKRLDGICGVDNSPHAFGETEKMAPPRRNDGGASMGGDGEAPHTTLAPPNTRLFRF